MFPPALLDIDQIRELYVVQGLTPYAIQKHVKASPQTIKAFILTHRFEEERALYILNKKQRQEATIKALLDAEDGIKQSQQESGFQEYQPNQEGSKTERSEIVVAKPQPIQVTPEIEEDNSAFGRLTRRQQIFVIHFVKTRPNKPTNIEIGETMPGSPITNETVANWLDLPDIQEAILDLTRQKWKFQGELKLLDRFDDLIETGKERPEDRKLLADIYGLTSGQTVNLNFNISARDTNLKTRFSA